MELRDLRRGGGEGPGAEPAARPDPRAPSAITTVYCSAVAVYLYVVPIGEMARVNENRIATEAAVRMIGPAGGAFIAVAILVSTFGCVNGLSLAGARVVYAMGRDGLFFDAWRRVHPVYRTPAQALVLHGVVAALLTLTGTYGDLLDLTAFSSLLFNVLTVVGLFVLAATAARSSAPIPRLGLSRPAGPLRPGVQLLPRLHPGGQSDLRRPRAGAHRPRGTRVPLLEEQPAA